MVEEVVWVVKEVKIAHEIVRFGDKRVRTEQYGKGQKMYIAEGVITLEEDCTVDITETFKKRVNGDPGGYWDAIPFTMGDLRPLNTPTVEPEPPRQGFWARLFRKQTIPTAKVVQR